MRTSKRGAPTCRRCLRGGSSDTHRWRGAARRPTICRAFRRSTCSAATRRCWSKTFRWSGSRLGSRSTQPASGRRASLRAGGLSVRPARENGGRRVGPETTETTKLKLYDKRIEDHVRKPAPAECRADRGSVRLGGLADGLHLRRGARLPLYRGHRELQLYRPERGFAHRPDGLSLGPRHRRIVSRSRPKRRAMPMRRPASASRRRWPGSTLRRSTPPPSGVRTVSASHSVRKDAHECSPNGNSSPGRMRYDASADGGGFSLLRSEEDEVNDESNITEAFEWI